MSAALEHAVARPTAQPDVDRCLDHALAHLQTLQRPDGSFEGEVVWCPMILAQYVILRALLKMRFDSARTWRSRPMSVSRSRTSASE